MGEDKGGGLIKRKIPHPPQNAAGFIHSAQKSADPSSGGKAFWDGLRQCSPKAGVIRRITPRSVADFVANKGGRNFEMLYKITYETCP